MSGRPASTYRGAAHQWLRGQQFELCVEAVRPSVGRGDAVVGDVVPDFDNVVDRLRATVTRAIYALATALADDR